MTKVLGALVALAALVSAQEASRQPVARVNGTPVYASDVATTPAEYQKQQELYTLRLQAVNSFVANKLLEEAAAKRDMTTQELIEVEVIPRVGLPTNKEVSDFYNENKERIGQPLKEVREALVQELTRIKAQSHVQDLFDSIKAEADVEILLEPNRYPMKLDDLDAARVQGPKNAPVTIVEFSDFQCPFCRQVQPTLGELREQYKGKVRWVFKDLPLEEIHPEAARAAQVARCAGDQGKFWEYSAKLFEQELFTDAMYAEVAEELKLKADPLMECANSAKYEEAVNAEALEGQSLGVSGTPAFFVNGIFHPGAQPLESFQFVIDDELKRIERASN